MTAAQTVLLATMMALGVGCSTVSTKPSGFLGHYEDLKPVKPGSRSLVFADPVAAREYHAVIIDPIIFEPNAAAGLKPDYQACLSSNLNFRAHQVFSEKYQIVEDVGPGVLRLRIAVNDINRASPPLNVIATAAVFVPLDMGAIAVEMEAVDSVTGRRVGALLDKRQGSPMTPAGFFGSFTSAGHAKNGFTRLSETMLKLMLPEPAS